MPSQCGMLLYLFTMAVSHQPSLPASWSLCPMYPGQHELATFLVLSFALESDPQVCSLLDAAHLTCIKVWLHWHLFQILLGQVYTEGNNNPSPVSWKLGPRAAGPRSSPSSSRQTHLPLHCLLLWPFSQALTSYALQRLGSGTPWRAAHRGGLHLWLWCSLSWVTRGPASQWLT